MGKATRSAPTQSQANAGLAVFGGWDTGFGHSSLGGQSR